MAVISLPEAKAYLGIADAVTTDDTLIAVMILASVSALEKEVHHTFESASKTEIRNGKAVPRIWLSEAPESITSLHSSFGQVWDSSTLVDSDNYFLQGRAILKSAGCWNIGNQNYRVIMAVGFASIPDEITMGVRIQLAKMFSEFEAAKERLTILSKISVEGWSMDFLAKKGLDPVAVSLCKLGVKRVP